MPFDWNEFLNLAEDLATRNDEASKRTAISRAYYAVFHSALARATQRSGQPPQNVPVHGWCWGKYQSTNDMACHELGNKGSRLKRRRTLADYKENIPRIDDEVRAALEEARRFPADLAALDAAFPTP